jgi:hypothetical protein
VLDWRRRSGLRILLISGVKCILIGRGVLAYSGDTVISGMIYHLLHTSYAAGYKPLAVREDTLLQKVYFRFNSHSNGDTSEHILYDYTLRIGDTLRIDFGSNHFSYAVVNIDSVMMGGISYKRWEMNHWFGFQNTPAYVIEGIGTNGHPLIPVFPTNFEQCFQLRCFSNRGVQHACSPATPLYFAYVTTSPFVPYPQPLAVRYFDNDSSCDIHYLPVAVDVVTMDDMPIMYPNPGGRDMVLKCPISVGSCLLTVYDALGSAVLRETVTGRELVPIGRRLGVAGVYFYSVRSLVDGELFSGRFVFQ